MTTKLDIWVFLSGMAFGTLITWTCCKKYYADLAQTEIDSVKEVYRRSSEKQDSHKVSGEDTTSRVIVFPDEQSGYMDYCSYITNKIDGKKEKVMEEKPYIIPPDEFGEEEDYELINLIYYAGNHILTDDNDEIISDIERTVGNGFENHFGEYEDDSVYIRNDRLKCYYEILRDVSSFINDRSMDTNYF